MSGVFGGRRSLKQTASVGPGLQFGYYATSCPNLTQIVADRVQFAVLQDIQTPGKLLRLFFHDCVAAGCDASILLNSTATLQAEKDATISVTLEKFEVIDDIKAHVEAVCPGIVSCADILALAAVNSVRLAGGPSFDIDLGRRDGVVSYLAAATASVPLSTMKLDALVASFKLAGLDQTDVVVLSGAHTIGQIRCTNFADRYDPAANSPFPDAAFGQELYNFCTRNGAAPDFATLNLKTFMDLQSPNMFDTSYYVNLIIGRGVMTSDQDLYNDPRTQPLVTAFASNRTMFFESFIASMLKLGRQGVLSGDNGVIRQQCWSTPTV
jgi:peroxidase